MHWELTEEQDLYADSLREWLAARAPAEQVRSWLDAGDQDSVDTAMTDAGWSGVGFAESVGGQGGGLLELALAARELGRVAAPSARWLARALSDSVLTGEPALVRAALEDGELTTVAVRTDRAPATTALTFGGGRVSGTVSCVLAGALAHRFVVPIASADKPALVVVERAAEGVQIRPRALLDRSRSAADVYFDATPARPLDCADVPRALTALRDRAAVLVAADSLGASERMLDMTVEYSKQRRQFGRPIAAFQAVKHAAAQMLVTVESAYSVALYAAASVQEGIEDCDLHAAAAKAQACGPCADLADSALTVHGAIGYTWEYDLQLFYKRAKLNRVLFGAPSEWNEFIAATLPLVS